MKKRLLSILLMCCMVLTLLPTTAFAEESTETPPVCSCETACTAESRNAECPVCGAEGASAENCAKYIKPADDAAVQPEGEVSDPQPETALTELIGGSETAKEVSTVGELTAAVADVKFDTVKLAANISISSSLTVNRTVTLDLNGYVLKYESVNKGSPLAVEDSGYLTIKDSGSNATHKFAPNSDGLWVLDEDNGTETVYGGVITGGTGYPIQFGSGAHVYDAYYGGAVYIKPGGTLNMEGGSIVGCSAVYGGGVYVAGEFVMTGGSIIGCAADRGGGVYMRDNDAVFNMSGSAAIRYCKAASKDTSYAPGGGVYALGAFTMSGNAAISNCECITGSGRAAGGGVYVSYHNKNTEFTMGGNAVIENCKVTASSQNSWTGSYGGGVYVSSRSSLTLKDQAAIRKCSAKNTAGGATYGGGIFAEGTLTIAGLAEVDKDCSAAVGSGIYMEVGPDFIVSQNLYANGGVIAGEVVLNSASNHGATLKITGSDEGVTEFKGSVLNNNGIIEKGKFTGEVTNNGTISGGVFTGTVSNNGTITGGVFNNTVSGSGTITGGTFNTPMTGSGTESDPYQISTADQLKLFRDIVNGAGGQTQNRGAWAVLTNDIVLNDGTFAEDGSYTPGPSGKTAEEWTPIGKYTNDSNKTPYTGTFDGKHYAIKGLYVVNLPDLVVGLFGGLEGAAVRNLTVDGYVQGCHVVSGIAGDASANSTIENCRNNCRVVSEFVTGRSSSFLYVGGIVGFAEDTTIVGCVNTGVVEARGSYNNSRASKAAGIVCTLCGNVIVKNCYNTGEINVTSDKLREGTAGGIAGSELSARNTVSDCYNLGAVTVSYTGNDVEYIAKAGGIMGYIFYSDTTVSNCYSVGTLTSTTGTGTSYIGGVVGITKGTVANCYYLDSTAEKAVWPAGGTVDEATGSKTAAQLGNGTVLALLINGRADSEHPWNSQCQYLAAAGKTLPVFKTQTGDAHTHDWSAWTSNGDGTHSRRCTCNAAETVIPKRQSSGSNYSYYTIKATAGTGGAISPSGNVSVREGRDQTFTITPDKGYAVANVKIDGKSIGAVKSYTFENVRRTHTIEVIFMKANGNPQTGVFVDVATGSYYEDAVDWAVENGITKGTDDTHFSPDGICTRAQAVTFLWRTAGSPASKTSAMPFTDVPVGSYYYDAVLWAVENGITKGTSDTTFSPDATCSRAQIVTFLWRSQKSPAVGSLNPFTDVSANAYYTDAVLWAVEENITKGTTATTFSPDTDCTRAQIVTLLYRAYVK